MTDNLSSVILRSLVSNSFITDVCPANVQSFAGGELLCTDAGSGKS